MGALKIDLRDGDVLRIGDTTVRMVYKAGRRCGLVIDAPDEVIIHCDKRPDAKEGQQEVDIQSEKAIGMI